MHTRLFLSAIMAFGAASSLAAGGLDLKALDRKCEAAREARIKPLRDAEIARCKSDKRNDPQYCERFYADLGNISRTPDGKLRPRMFEDIPECVAAREARRNAN